jgi:hypothetical protein
MSSAADLHVARMAQLRESSDPAVPMSPRSRLDSFRAQQARQAARDPAAAAAVSSRAASFRAAAPAAAEGGGFAISLPSAPADGTPTIPALSLGGASSSALASSGATDLDRPLSSRRLKKEILRADSTNGETSNSAGHVTLRDGSGTPRSVRVIQSEEFEDFNMVNVKWIYTLDTKAFQIVLRHGRRSGIRKIYVNKQLMCAADWPDDPRARPARLRLRHDAPVSRAPTDRAPPPRPSGAASAPSRSPTC